MEFSLRSTPFLSLLSAISSLFWFLSSQFHGNLHFSLKTWPNSQNFKLGPDFHFLDQIPVNLSRLFRRIGAILRGFPTFQRTRANQHFRNDMSLFHWSKLIVFEFLFKQISFFCDFWLSPIKLFSLFPCFCIVSFSHTTHHKPPHNTPQTPTHKPHTPHCY